MSYKLEQQCIEVMHSQTVKQFLGKIIEFAEGFNFQTVSATVITEHSPTLTEFQTIANVPHDYVDEFHDLNAARQDPVCQHCKHSAFPIVWDQRTYVSFGSGELWEQQAAHGYKSGVNIAMHYQRGRHFLFGIEADAALPVSSRNLNRIIHDVQVFASYAQAAAFELSDMPAAEQTQSEALTGRELEALRWSMDGKTPPEVGSIMGTSQKLAELRLRNAARKLGCSNRYEAVLRALRLGLISCG